MLERIKNIFYRPEFFRKQEFTGGQALGFYSLSVLMLVLGLSVLLIPAAWSVNRFFESAEWEKQRGIIERLYPSDLVLTLENGELRTNQDRPVMIPFPNEWRDSEEACHKRKQCDRHDLPTNLLVIDRTAELSRKAIQARDTLILASETEIGMSNHGRGETRIFGLGEINFDKKIEVTKSSFVYWVGRGADIIQTATLFLMAVLPLLMFIVLWIGYVVYALLGTLVVWLAAHIRNHRLSYGRAYLSTLYLLPASFVVMVLMSALSFRVPFLFTLVLFGMALINFERKEKEKIVPGPFSPAAKSVDPTTPTTPSRPEEV